MKLSKRFSLAVLAAAALLLPAPDAVAQGVQMNVQVGGVSLSGGWHSTTDPQRMSLFLDLQIAEMKAVCELSDGQTKKLTLAGKSTVQKLFSKAGMKLKIGLGQGGNPPKSVEEDSLSDEDREIQESDDRDTDGIPITIPVRLKQVTDHSLWKKAVKSVLTEEQQAQWTESRTQRDQRTREQLVNRRVIDLERQLLLQPAQIAAVTEIIERVEGDQLLKDFRVGPKGVLGRLKRGKTQVSEADLRNVLTDAQMNVWKTRDQTSGDAGLLKNLMGTRQGANKSATRDIGIEFDGSGLEVKSVEAKSHAAALGIQAGDLIDSVDGEPVDTSLQFENAMKRAGKNASVTVIRDNVEIRLENQ